MSGDSKGLLARRRDRKEAEQLERARLAAEAAVRREKERQAEEATWLLRQANGLVLTPDCQADFVAKRGESGFFSLPARLVEPRSSTYRAYASKRVNLGGFKFRVGGSAPVQRTAMTAIDEGTMIVTSQRVLFVGGKATREWLFSKVVGYDDSDPSCLLINVSNRQKTSGLAYDARWDKVVEAYFLSAVTKATDPDDWTDQIQAALAPVASRLSALGYDVYLSLSREGDRDQLPPPVPGTAAT
jgi:hypothetical protein